MLQLVCLMVIFVEAVISDQDIKIWAEDTNYNNARNWATGRVPCSKDSVIFPADARVVTFMPSTLTFSDLVLPTDVELIFPNGADFRLNRDTSDSCVGKDTLYRVNDDFWYDPQRWNVSSPNAHPKDMVSRDNAAVPHAWRVPCPTDHVVFPKDHTFKVHLDSDPVTISSIEINGMNFDHTQLEGMRNSHIGKLLFSGSSEIQVTGRSCHDPSGCLCENTRPEVLSKICSYLQCDTSHLQCLEPIKVFGHCCPICGAYLKIEMDEGFEISRFSSYVESFLTEVNFGHLYSFTSKIQAKVIQSVFVDGKSEAGGAEQVSERLRNQLIKDINEANQYRIKSVQIYKSSQWNGDSPTHYAHVSEISASGVIAIIFVVCAVIGCSIAWYIYKKRRIPGFTFARFDLYSNKVELELGTTPHDELDPEESVSTDTPAKAFDNPVYDTIQEHKEEPLIEPLDEEEHMVENPMFTVFENQED